MAGSSAASAAWVQPPEPIRGLDHLGVQAPCVAIYTQLLPGITNVTDRARYYSFHPWLIWSFERRGLERTPDAFARFVRRAECLFALVGLRHGRVSGDQDTAQHDAAVVGRQKLSQVEADEFDLGEFAALEGPRRYFKNRYGGLGQYYFGPLRDLRVLDSVEGAPRGLVGYDKTRGHAIATAFEAVVDHEQFFAVLEAPTVRTEDLDALASFCPCRLRTNDAERDLLLDLFLARVPTYQADGGLVRRDSLALLLDLIDRGADRDPMVDVVDAFRTACYAGALPDGTTWAPPAALARVAAGWATYQRNELLSVGLQSLFAALLRAVDDRSAGRFDRPSSMGPLALDLCRGLGSALLERPLPRAVEETAAALPALEAWNDDGHELQLGRRCPATFEEGEIERLGTTAIRILLAIAARGLPAYPYADLALDPEYFSPREIHLVSFRDGLMGSWRALTVGSWIEWLAVRWGIERHLRVALRKLRGQRQDTFRVRPLEIGFQVVDAPPPAFTVPRLGRAVQILLDLGLVERGADGLALTPSGRVERERTCG